MKARGAKAKDEFASGWNTLRANLQDQFETMHTKIEERQEEHGAKVAEHRADWAESYAIDAVDFAYDAVVEAEAAVLEATDLRKNADAMAAGRSGGSAGS